MVEAMTEQPRYKLGELLVSGSTADVYRAELTDIDGPWRHVAIKRIRSHLAGDAEQRAAMLAGARLSSRLEHPNIVTTLDAEEHDGTVVVILELVDGLDLAVLMERAAIPWPVAVHVARVVLDALAYAHDCGIIHRDVAPKNVLVSREGAIKLGDFGLAVIDEGENKPGEGENEADEGENEPIAGTPAYVSPEMLQGLAVDHRADLHAVGTMLYQMLTGELPHGNVPAGEYFARVLTRDAAPPSTIAPEIPRALDAIVLRLLERDREERYQAATEPRDALMAFRANDSPRVLADLVAGRGETWPPRARQPLPLPPPPRRTRWGIAPLLVLVGTLAGIGGAFLVSGDDTRPSPSTAYDIPGATHETLDRSSAPDGVRRAIAPETPQNAQESIANERRACELQARRKPVRARPRRLSKRVRFEWLGDPGREPRTR